MMISAQKLEAVEAEHKYRMAIADSELKKLRKVVFEQEKKIVELEQYVESLGGSL